MPLPSLAAKVVLPSRTVPEGSPPAGTASGDPTAPPSRKSWMLLPLRTAARKCQAPALRLARVVTWVLPTWSRSWTCRAGFGTNPPLPRMKVPLPLTEIIGPTYAWGYWSMKRTTRVWEPPKNSEKPRSVSANPPQVSASAMAPSAGGGPARASIRIRDVLRPGCSAPPPVTLLTGAMARSGPSSHNGMKAAPGRTPLGEEDEDVHEQPTRVRRQGRDPGPAPGPRPARAGRARRRREPRR